MAHRLIIWGVTLMAFYLGCDPDGIWGVTLMAQFIELKEIEPRARKILSSEEFESFDQQEQLAIKTFMDTIDGEIEDPI